MWGDIAFSEFGNPYTTQNKVMAMSFPANNYNAIPKYSKKH